MACSGQKPQLFPRTITIPLASDSSCDYSRTCTICLQTYRNPKLLSCLHTFCEQCLSKLLINRADNRASAIKKPTFNCPICRKKQESLIKNGVAALPNNFLVYAEEDDAVEKAKCQNGTDDNLAIGFCYECECLLCDDCVALHKKMVATRKHSTVSLEKLEEDDLVIYHYDARSHPIVCPTHGEVQKMYCEKCNVVICCECAIIGHKSHDCRFLKELCPEVSKRLKDSKKKIKDKQGRIVSHLAELKELIDTSEEDFTVGEKAINKACDRIIRIVEEHRHSLINYLKGLTVEPAKKAKEEIISTKTSLTNSFSALHIIESIDTSSEVQLATMGLPLLKMMEQDCSSLTYERSLSTLSQPYSKPLSSVSDKAVTNGGDMNQLRAQLPKIVHIQSPNIIVYLPCDSVKCYSQKSDNKHIKLKTRYDLLYSVKVEPKVSLMSGGINVPWELKCIVQNCEWEVTFERLDGEQKYELKASFNTLPSESWKFTCHKS